MAEDRVRVEVRNNLTKQYLGHLQVTKGKLTEISLVMDPSQATYFSPGEGNEYGEKYRQQMWQAKKSDAVLLCFKEIK